MSTTTEPAQPFVVGDETDRALKARHAALWALGDYPTVAATVIPTLGALLVDRAAVRPGERVLDVAAGDGNAALPAARAGASVVAADLCPVLLDAGRARSAALPAEVRERLTWQAADAEALPFEDGAFDVVLSCVGVMFAPHHRAAAAELVRVCRPGGRIALLSWTPEGFLGRMLGALRPFVPAPPPGAQPPPLWGSESHVRDLLGDAVTGVLTERGLLRVDHFATGAQFRDFFKAAYGPTVAAYRGLADRPDDAVRLDAALADLADEHLVDGVMEWEYLVVVARRA